MGDGTWVLIVLAAWLMSLLLLMAWTWQVIRQARRQGVRLGGGVADLPLRVRLLAGPVVGGVWLVGYALLDWRSFGQVRWLRAIPFGLIGVAGWTAMYLVSPRINRWLRAIGNQLTGPRR
jgi:hypothetical protein